MNRLMKNLRYATRTTLGRHELLFPLLATFPTCRSRMVDADTEICIEGFPRSVNTSALHAFQLWNPASRAAHHLHVPMQVVRAAARGLCERYRNLAVKP